MNIVYFIFQQGVGRLKIEQNPKEHLKLIITKMLSNNASASFESIDFGRGSKNRTHDTRFWRPLLYLLSYTPINNYYIIEMIFCQAQIWWAIRDSNPRPTGYEPDALTNWANGPKQKHAHIQQTEVKWLLLLYIVPALIYLPRSSPTKYFQRRWA